MANATSRPGLLTNEWWSLLFAPFWRWLSPGPKVKRFTDKD